MSNYSNRIEFEDIKNQNIKEERIDGFLSLEIQYFFKSYLTWSIYSSRYSEKKKKRKFGGSIKVSNFAEK